MFSISTKGKYGLTAVFELAINNKDKCIKIKEIANKYNYDKHYIEQIFFILRKNDIVKSFRGSSGGYKLTESPDKIKVIDILKILEGNIDLKDEKNNELDFFWSDLKKQIEKLLNLTLQDLIDKKIEQNQILNFSI